ncbi:hypothetical protein B0H14DRAFT_3588188 [Mycena olivaceomarginata]|nr:hypothetical protein B0H14DRAFT_3588188 [Mycena olivaceomarginata]
MLTKHLLSVYRLCVTCEFLRVAQASLLPSLPSEHVSLANRSILAAPNSDELLKDLATLVSHRGVVFFTDQDIEIEKQKELGMRLGRLGGNPATSTLHVHPISELTPELTSDVSVISSEGYAYAAGAGGRAAETVRRTVWAMHTVTRDPLPALASSPTEAQVELTQTHEEHAKRKGRLAHVPPLWPPPRQSPRTPSPPSSARRMGAQAHTRKHHPPPEYTRRHGRLPPRGFDAWWGYGCRTSTTRSSAIWDRSTRGWEAHMDSYTLGKDMGDGRDAYGEAYADEESESLGTDTDADGARRDRLRMLNFWGAFAAAAGAGTGAGTTYTSTFPSPLTPMPSSAVCTPSRRARCAACVLRCLCLRSSFPSTLSLLLLLSFCTPAPDVEVVGSAGADLSLFLFARTHLFALRAAPFSPPPFFFFSFSFSDALPALFPGGNASICPTHTTPCITHTTRTISSSGSTHAETSRAKERAACAAPVPRLERALLLLLPMRSKHTRTPARLSPAVSNGAHGVAASEKQEGVLLDVPHPHEPHKGSEWCCPGCQARRVPVPTAHRLPLLLQCRSLPCAPSHLHPALLRLPVCPCPPGVRTSLPAPLPPRPLPPCRITTDVKCGCAVCGRTLACGAHMCTRPYHADTCDPCAVDAHAGLNVPLARAATPPSFSGPEFILHYCLYG